MKFTLVFVVAFVVHVEPQVPDLKFAIVRDKCVLELTLDPGTDQILPGWDAATTWNHNQKCLLRCILRNLGYFTLQNDLSEDFIQEKLVSETPETIEMCQKKITPGCEGAYEVIRCLNVDLGF